MDPHNQKANSLNKRNSGDKEETNKDKIAAWNNPRGLLFRRFADYYDHNNEDTSNVQDQTQDMLE